MPAALACALAVFRIRPRFRRRAAIAVVLAGACAVTLPARAQVHQCLQDGRRTFQQQPCPSGAVTEAAPKPAPRPAATWPWEGLRSGMTLAEVRAIHPEAVPLHRDRLHDGAEGELTRSLTLQGVPFRATWYFRGGAYQQVNLTTDPSFIDNAEVERLFAALEPRLIEHLGAPATRTFERRPAGLFGGSDWALAGNGRAWITAVPVRATTSLLSIGLRAGAPR